MSCNKLKRCVVISILISNICLMKISEAFSSSHIVQPRGLVQTFIRQPVDQTARQGEHVTLPCQVENKRGMLQWTRDGFGLGVERNLTGFDRYHMIGSNEEGNFLHVIEYLNTVYYRSTNMMFPVCTNFIQNYIDEFDTLVNESQTAVKLTIY